MRFEDEFRQEPSQETRDELLEELLVEMGVPTPLAAQNAVLLGSLELVPGARFVALHPYSVGMLLERAAQIAGVKRLVLEVTGAPGGGGAARQNRVNVTIHEVEHELAEPDAIPRAGRKRSAGKTPD